ncbi:glycosyltransferase family 4 protein [Terriglobus roseus]|uniref:glycosyltransferase family 4 protein n=1 Tax=Terriglobus roseus TaxID=392734 RepID=UPI001561A312|nr:glycosyltransferase family 1 protein [Terriglobus roseus]
MQHRHYPKFFSPQDYRVRETQYPAFCERARFVCVQTEWTKQDVVTQYGLDPNKVVVIRWGTAFEAYSQPSAEDIEGVRQDLVLPEQFFLYPAICWPHKNHAVILRALALLKTRKGPAPHVVFTGKPAEYQKTVEALAQELGVADKVSFLGFTTSSQIQVLFHLATALLFPSHFEGLGLPILEAFRAGLPVISSNATVLSEVTGDAALLFPPNSPEELADAMEKILASPELREKLSARGAKVLENYSIEETARQFFRLYRRIAIA